MRGKKGKAHTKRRRRSSGETEDHRKVGEGSKGKEDGGGGQKGRRATDTDDWRHVSMGGWPRSTPPAATDWRQSPRTWKEI